MTNKESQVVCFVVALAVPFNLCWLCLALLRDESLRCKATCGEVQQVHFPSLKRAVAVLRDSLAPEIGSRVKDERPGGVETRN